MQLRRTFSSLETWGFGFTGLLLWILTVPSIGAGDRSALLVWIPVALAGMTVNLHVRHLGTQWPDMIGGTAAYAARLLQDKPLLARYAACAYMQGWVSVPPLSAIGITALAGIESGTARATAMRVIAIAAFTAVAFIIGLAGTRALSILHLFFIIPAVGLLLLFAVQGMLWLVWNAESLKVRLPDVTSIDFSQWSLWYFVAVYAAYGVETSAGFVGESRKPAATLRCLLAAAILIPVVFIGGSFVFEQLLRVSGGSDLTSIITARPHFWGSWAPFLTTFMIASGFLLSCATAVALVPRVLYQLSRDGLCHPAFTAVARNDVPVAGLMFTAVNMIPYLLLDFETALLLSGTGYFVSMMLLHFGLWHQRHAPEVRWPHLALVLLAIETVVFAGAAVSLGPGAVLAGLAAPAVVALLTNARKPIDLLHAVTVSRRAKEPRLHSLHTSEALQVAILIALICGAVSAGWAARGIAGSEAASLLPVLLITAGFFGVALAAWTTLRQFAAVAVARRETQEFLTRYELILNSAGDGIFGLDSAGHVTFVNNAASRMLQYEPADLIGKDMHAVAHHTHADGSPYRWEECPAFLALTGGSARTSDEEVFWRRDRTSFAVDYFVAPMYEASGTVAGAVVTFRDVTDRREVDRMKSEFVSTVSHELRTPLTSIRGSLGLLAAGVLGQVTDKGHRMLQIAISNTDRLIRLINDILDIERLESGRVPIERTHLRAADLLHESVEVMRASAAHAGIVLQIRAESGATVFGDHDRLVQTITNLIGNAIKFSPAESTVTLSAEPHESMMRFAVGDQGRGIPADKLESIFARFHQVDASDAREKGGTGLGLAICRTIVEQHGGRIWVESVVGKGSTFYFTVPCADEPSLPGSSGPVSARPPVLVCDDDASVRVVVKEMLETRGYAVVTVDRGERAVELARTLKPCAIVLDLLMDGMSGWDTVARLRENEDTEAIPVIVASVLSRREADAKQPLSGHSLAGWVQKPFDETVLFASLDSLGGRCLPENGGA